MTVDVDLDSVRIAVVLHDEPNPRELKLLRRLVDLGQTELRARIASGEPLIRVLLFQDNHLAVASRLLELAGLIAPYRHEFHEVDGDEPLTSSNEISAETLREILTVPEAD